MKTKLVYVVVSSEKDIYLEQACVSMYSAKFYNPDIFITLLVDDKTNNILQHDSYSAILQYSDEIIVEPLGDSYSPMEKSRLLKTSVRNLVHGTILYVDSDTIICGSLKDLDNLDCDIAAVWDTHCRLNENPHREIVIGKYAKILNHDYENDEEYFNSGVLFCKENHLTCAFYKQWNDNYREGLQHNVRMDQPSLALTNSQMGFVIKQLPDIYNCQLKFGYKYINDAIILHYLSTTIGGYGNNCSPFMNAELYEEVKKNRGITGKIKDLVNNPKVLSPGIVMYVSDEFFIKKSSPFTVLYNLHSSPNKWDKIQYRLSAKLIRFLNSIFVRLKALIK